MSSSILLIAPLSIESLANPFCINTINGNCKFGEIDESGIPIFAGLLVWAKVRQFVGQFNSEMKLDELRTTNLADDETTRFIRNALERKLEVWFTCINSQL